MRTTTMAAAVAGLGAVLVAGLLPASAVAAPGPLASWEMTESTGSTMRDSSPNDLDGDVGSQVRMLGGIYSLSGSTTPSSERLVQVPDSSLLDPGTASYAVSVRLRTTTRNPNIVQKGQSRVSGGFWKVVLTDGYPRCQFRDADGVTLTADLRRTGTANRVDDGLWHEVRCELTDAGARIVLDAGTAGEVSKLKRGTLGRIANNRPLTVGGKLDCDGQNVGCDYFTGDLDYVRVSRP